VEGKHDWPRGFQAQTTDNSQNPSDKSTTKRNLDYWINLAKLLERGDINALFLADTYGGYDTYEQSLDECIRRAAQWPVTDPTIVSGSFCSSKYPSACA
jgi:alkanesulfonate monooxygenase SsuD/methylene tetrahydromethanopterin reductase-like flavin-dependent oxidoreductase (luciferase family)